MFYETRVFDAYGNIKQTISAQDLKNRHWSKFQQSEANLSIYPKKKTSTPARKTENKGLLLNKH